MIELNSRQRKILEKYAYAIKPVVIVGQNGVTPSLENKIMESLDFHELIKVKFNYFKEEKRELSEMLCSKCNALLVRIIGNTAIFYKENEEPEKRIYKINDN